MHKIIKHMIKHIIALSLLSLCLSIAQAAKPEVFEPSFPQFWDSAANRKNTNQFYALGQATFNNNVKVPMYGVTVENPMEDGLLKDAKACGKNDCIYKFTLTPQQASQLKLIVLPSIGLTLVPKSWNNIQATAGANGTGSVVIMNPQGNEAIDLYNSSACVGCGLPYATLYFPHILKESIESEFGGYVDPHKKINLVHPSKTTAFFSYQIPKFGAKTHGIAKYYDEDTFNKVSK